MINVTSNIGDLVQRFKLIRELANNIDLSDALLIGVNAAKATMQFRIFNKGLDSNEVSLGKYAGPKKTVDKTGLSDFLVGNSATVRLSQYEKKRVKKGRQIRYKDLEFQGALRRGILVIKDSSVRVVCAIPNNDLFTIANAQEEYLQTEIFALSDRERELLRTNVIAAINQIYVRLFNS